MSTPSYLVLGLQALYKITHTLIQLKIDFRVKDDGKIEARIVYSTPFLPNHQLYNLPLTTNDTQLDCVRDQFSKTNVQLQIYHSASLTSDTFKGSRGPFSNSPLMLGIIKTHDSCLRVCSSGVGSKRKFLISSIKKDWMLYTLERSRLTSGWRLSKVTYANLQAMQALIPLPNVILTR